MVLLVLALSMGVMGPLWPAWAAVLLTDSVLALGWAAGLIGWGVWLAPARRADGDASPARGLATAFALGLGTVGLAALLLGLAGWLNRGVAWALVASGWVGVLGRIAWLRKRGTPWGISVSAWSWQWLAGVPALAVLSVAPAVLPGVLWGDEPHGYDVVSYHLQVPREWHDAGRITRLDHNVFSNFPLLMEVHYLLAMHLRGGAYAGMYAAQYQHAITALMAAVAVYGLLGGRARGPAVAGGVLVLAVPWTSLAGSVAYNEAGLMLLGALAVGGLMSALRQGASAGREAGVAGAMAGFACGVKLTAVPMLVMVPALAGLITRPAAWRRVVVFVMVAGVVSGPWWVRNVAWSGNPVFPEATGLLGGTHWSPAQAERWRVAHGTPGGTGEARKLAALASAAWEQVLANWRYGYVLVPLAGLAMVLPIRRDARRERVFLGLVLLGMALFWLGLTHLQGRFFTAAIPVVALGCGLAWQAIDRPWLRHAIGGVMVAAVAVAAACGAVPLVRLTEPSVRVFGMSDPEALWGLRSEAIARAAKDRPVALAGDAAAFWWPVPAGRLTYRTVFDVDRRAGEGLTDAWTRGAPADAVIVVDPASLRRFVRTYRGLGDLPPDLAGREEPFVIER